MGIAIITGASRGIGKAIAKKLAKDGNNIIFNYLKSEEEAKKLEEELRSYGVEAYAYKCDVSDFSKAKEFFDEVKTKFGNIDIIVNNAGITRDGFIIRMSEDDFDSVIATNLKGTFNCCKFGSRIMLKQRSGSIVNISSVSGIKGNAGQTNYSASKAGVIGLTKSLAKEIASANIRVNAIAPGFIKTDMTDAISDKIKENILKEIPFARMGEVEDIAEMVSFLVSEKAKYITGQVIAIDGGVTI